MRPRADYRVRLEGTCPEQFQEHTCSVGSILDGVGKLMKGEEVELAHGDNCVQKLSYE